MEGHVPFMSVPHSPAYLPKLDLFGSADGPPLHYERLQLPDPMYVHVNAPTHKKDSTPCEEMQVPAGRFMKLVHSCGPSETPEHFRSNQSGKEAVRNLLISYIPRSASVGDIRRVFEHFGTVCSASTGCEGNGKCKGIGSVLFAEHSAAKSAAEACATGSVILEDDSGNTWHLKASLAPLQKGHSKPRKETQVLASRFMTHATSARPCSANETPGRFQSEESGNEASKTLLVAYIPRRASAEEIQSFFGHFGTVCSATIMREDNGQSKCFGFVEFSKHEAAKSAKQACAAGHAILEDDDFKAWHLKASWARKQSNERGSRMAAVSLRTTPHKGAPDGASKTLEYFQSDQSSSKAPRTLLIAYIPRFASEEEMKSVFGHFGTLCSANIMRERNGQSKCFGFVVFADHAGAKCALEACATGRVILEDDNFKAWHLKASWAWKEGGKGEVG